MRFTHHLRAAALVLALSACGKTSDDTSASLDHVPDLAGLTLETQDSTAALALADSDLATDAAALTLTTTPDVNDDLAAARAKIAAVNEAVRSLLAQLAEVAKAQGVPAPGEATVYGPVARCIVPTACDAGGTATLRLRLARAFGNTWAFALEAQVGAEFKPVVAGWMRRGQAVRRGVGRIAVNLENLRAAAPAYTGQGYLLGGFSNGPVAKTLHYRLLTFTPDPARWSATTAAFRGFKTAAGVTRVRVAGIEDFYGNADSELGFGHVAHHPAIGGRAYSVVTNYTAGGVTHGDVPASAGGAAQYFFGRACYAAGATTPTYKEWFLCARGVGPRACVLAQLGAGTPVVGTPDATWQSACARPVEPSELQLPEDPPAATPEDGAAEAGEGQAGLDPEAPPATVEDVNP